MILAMFFVLTVAGLTGCSTRCHREILPQTSGPTDDRHTGYEGAPAAAHSLVEPVVVVSCQPQPAG